MTKALDFDGVIHWYRRGWQGGKIYDPPMPGAIEGIQTIMEVEAVVVFTARTDLDAVCEWLESHGIECVSQEDWDSARSPGERVNAFWNEMGRVLVTNRKPAATHYLDDRAVVFGKGGWEQALADMEITPSETYHTYLITVKLPKNPTHNPRKKIMGPCPVNGEPCSDVTGEHHTVLMRGTQGIEWVRDKYARQYHVTRVESVPGNIPF